MPSRRVLIVYASHFGQTARVAEALGDRLRAAGASVLLARVNDIPPLIPPATYDAVVVGASVNYGKHQRSIRRFARENRDELQRVPSAFYSVSGAACSPDEAPRSVAERYITDFVQETGWKPAMTESVAGAMAYTKYSPLMRWMMKRISQREGRPADTSRDYEYTDWEQVRRFADRFADALTVPEGALTSSSS